MMGLTQKGTFVLRGRSLIALCVGGDQWRRWANFIVSSRFPYHLKRTPQKMCATFLTLPRSGVLTAFNPAQMPRLHFHRL